VNTSFGEERALYQSNLSSSTPKVLPWSQTGNSAYVLCRVDDQRELEASDSPIHRFTKKPCTFKPLDRCRPGEGGKLQLSPKSPGGCGSPTSERSCELDVRQKLPRPGVETLGFQKPPGVERCCKDNTDERAMRNVLVP
jgi:hypothetical protein